MQADIRNTLLEYPRGKQSTASLVPGTQETLLLVVAVELQLAAPADLEPNDARRLVPTPPAPL